MPVRDATTDDLSALFSLVRDVRDDVLEMKSDMKHSADHGERITKLELEHARTQGAIRVLLWLIPGGPALLALLGAVALYATR